MVATRPWTVRLRELVLGGPVPMHRAMAEMTVLIPPGRAYRDGERQKDWHRARADAKPTSRRRPVQADEHPEAVKDARIRRGARRLAYQAIWEQKRSGHVELYEDDGVQMVRMGPKPWDIS